MRLKSLTIEMNDSWRENPGQYTGKVKYEGKDGAFTLNLDTVLSAKVLAAVGEAAEESSRIMLDKLHTDIGQSIAEASGKALELNSPKEC